MRLFNTQKLAMELNDSILRLNTLLEDKPTDTSTSTGLYLLEIKNLSGVLKHIKDVKEYNNLIYYICQKLHSYKDILISYIKEMNTEGWIFTPLCVAIKNLKERKCPIYITNTL